MALEHTLISGIYVVVKFGRADEMVESTSKVMDFVGTKDIRIIITHADIAEHQLRFNLVQTKQRFSTLLDVPICNIAAVGKATHPDDIESFIQETLHPLTKFEVSPEQYAYASSFCVGARKFQLAVNDIYAKIESSTLACHQLVAAGRNLATDYALRVTETATMNVVEEDKRNILCEAQELTAEQQHILQGKMGFSLSLCQRDYHQMIRTHLSHCNTTQRHSYSSYTSYLTASLIRNESGGWHVQYKIDEQLLSVDEVIEKLQEIHLSVHSRNTNRKRKEPGGSTLRHFETESSPLYQLGDADRQNRDIAASASDTTATSKDSGPSCCEIVTKRFRELFFFKWLFGPSMSP